MLTVMCNYTIGYLPNIRSFFFFMLLLQKQGVCYLQVKIICKKMGIFLNSLVIDFATLSFSVVLHV